MKSTVKKGTLFEKKIFTLLREQIEQGRFMFYSSNAKIFRRKAYYSRDRDSDIVFDISIELYLPGEDQFSLLILVECKDLGKAVPVDDIEEFYSKTQQVFGGTVKGIVVSSNSFQSGAIRFAKAKHFGLMRYSSHTDFKWLLTRSPSSLNSMNFSQTDWNDAGRGLTEEFFQSRYYDFHCYSGGAYSNSTVLFFHHLIFNDSPDDLVDRIHSIIIPLDKYECRVPFKSRDQIESLSKNLLNRIDYSEGIVRLESIYEQDVESGTLSVEFLDDSRSNRLGEISFKPTSIKIYHDSDSRRRQKYTLAHELGHYFLAHDEFMSGEYCDENDVSFSSSQRAGIKEIARMEWQANHFASCLLLPSQPLLEHFWNLLKEHDLKDHGFGFLYVDNQPVNILSFKSITGKLINEFDVSRSAIKFRLEGLGLLNDDR